MTDINATEAELRQFIERAEHLAAEKRDIAEQEKEVFAEARGRGFDEGDAESDPRPQDCPRRAGRV